MTQTPKLPHTFADKTILITGASRGIGRATALAFAQQGANLILLARTRGALEELDDEIKSAGGQAALVQMNLTDTAKLDLLGPSLIERFGHIDGLVANAGILGPLSPLTHISDKDWDLVLATNLSANWRLIRTLDPLLRRAEAGRAVFLTSGAAKSCRAYWGPYAVSKAALEAVVKVYAKELATTAARANLLDPGIVRTAMRAKAMPGEDPATLPDPSVLAPIIMSLCERSFVGNGELVKAEDCTLYPAQYRRG